MKTHKPIKRGDKFGRLIVLKLRSKRKVGRGYWHLCLCECGNKKDIYDYCLKSGGTKSCGCFQDDSRRISRPKTHGMTGTPERESWAQMKSRCRNPNNSNYHNYGGRGIDFCARWEKFENFFKDMGHRPTGFSLDRIDNNKGYSKKNCRWANSKIQMRNTRANVFITYGGETKTVSEWAEFLGIKDPTLRARLFAMNWSIKKAFETRPYSRHRGKNLQ